MTALPTLFADQQQNDLSLHEQLVRTLREVISGWGGPSAPPPRRPIMTVLPTLFADQQQNDLPLHEQLVRTLREAISGWGGHLPRLRGGQS